MSLPTLEQYTAEARGLVVRGEFWLTVDGETRHLVPGGAAHSMTRARPPGVRHVPGTPANGAA